MILITGAGGKTGKAVAQALVARGEPVRALVHRDQQAAELTALGARQVSVGDLRDGEALSQAANGANAIYHIAPNVSPIEVPIGQAVMAAAIKSGIRRLVFHSVLHPQLGDMPHHWDKLRVEEMLLSADLDVTILQPTAYMQNILAGWDRMTQHGVYRVPYPTSTRLSLVDLEDVAEAAALVITSSRHAGATYELVGTSPLDQGQVAEILGEALGRRVRAESQSVEEWDSHARRSGMGDYQRETLLKMFRCYARNGLVGNPNVLGWLLDRTPTNLLAFALRTAGAEPTILPAAAASAP